MSSIPQHEDELRLNFLSSFEEVSFREGMIIGRPKGYPEPVVSYCQGNFRERIDMLRMAFETAKKFDYRPSSNMKTVW